MTARGLRVAGELTVPGDKSISHRSLICSALADGTSQVRAILQSADVHSTAGVLRALGVAIPELGESITITGVGLKGLRTPQSDLDCGNSGTSTRLLAGVVAGSGLTGRFIGDASLSGRPMRRIARPLTAMGATVDLPEHGGLPMTVRGGPMKEIEWNNETGSAQVKSCIMLAALCGGVEAKVSEPSRSRDHTERMLASQGAEVWVNEQAVLLHPVQRLTPLDITVPGDPSSAAFFAALAALAPRGELLLRRVCVNETRVGFLAALKEMGASIELENRERLSGEWVADVHVVAGASLQGISIGREAIPTLIDELPLVACLAAYAQGETRVTGAEELRVKESDRIAVVVGNLRALGADAEELPDGYVVRGTSPVLRGTVVTHGDHRMAMAFGILASLPGNEIAIDDRDCVAVSYPSFWTDLARVTAA
ncbi:MAG TPA: 3-phosphoshikimate 1-carboxyvinyltransferase [Gemmatimonadaceae bacterium]|jgi:3-phosphoshikimate 1-carboxyvinyltransferase|nr:3-phosphoshikimate 1-carboxyvinyltransferase [Gemmatimonadaceae bacterium]